MSIQLIPHHYLKEQARSAVIWAWRFFFFFFFFLFFFFFFFSYCLRCSFNAHHEWASNEHPTNTPPLLKGTSAERCYMGLTFLLLLLVLLLLLILSEMLIMNEHPMSIHCASTAHPTHIHHPSTVHATGIHRTSNVHPPCIHCASNTHPFGIQLASSFHPLRIQCASYEHPVGINEHSGMLIDVSLNNQLIQWPKDSGDWSRIVGPALT